MCAFVAINFYLFGKVKFKRKDISHNCDKDILDSYKFNEKLLQTEGGGILTDLFRKSTWSGRYLNYNSYYTVNL
jgi:hypothetical protein